MSNKSANQNSVQKETEDIPLNYFKYPFCPYKSARIKADERNKSWKRNSEKNLN